MTENTPGSGSDRQEHGDPQPEQGRWGADAGTPPPSPWASPGGVYGGYPGARHSGYDAPNQDVSGQPHGEYGQASPPPPYSPTAAMPPVDHPPHPQAYPPPVQQQKKSGGVTATLVAGIAVLALLAGGVAGGIGGYLVSNNETTTVSAAPNALDAPPPAKQTSTAPQGSVEYAAQKLLPSVVELSVQSPTSAGKGSGVVFSKDGMILTNNHVVQGAGQGGQIVAKFYDGQTAPATVVGTDPTSDLAVVKVSGVSGLTPADFGRSDDLRVGQQVIAAGSPFELSNTVTSGIVSSLHRPVRAGGEGGGQVTVLDAIQTDAPINPGNSGGPLVNTAGQVIGINSAIYSPSQSSGLPGADQQAGNVGVGFAIPVDQARRVGDQLAKTGAATQAMLQVTVTDARQGEGAQIVNVNRGGAAAKAGVQSGSVVVNADNRPIDSADGLIALVHSHKPGDRVTLKFEDGTSAQVTLAGEKVGG